MNQPMKPRPYRDTDEQWDKVLERAPKLKMSAAEFVRLAVKEKLRRGK